jgi:transposase InsO family protein
LVIRDRDRIYGIVVTRRLRAMGIRDKPTAPASPWQNGYAERLIGSIWHECLDHVIVLGEAHLRWVSILFHNTHPSMRLKRRGFADLDAIPWGGLGSASRDERRAEPPVRRALIG